VKFPLLFFLHRLFSPLKVPSFFLCWIIAMALT
jgi:hypothetical protein